jgi:transposase-like protein
MAISPGFTALEIREFVHEYQVLSYGSKTAWLAARAVTYHVLRRWRETVFEGDLDRGLIPRQGGPMTIPPGKRTAFERARAAERAADAAEVARLSARVRELEETNTALGKAIGLLHMLSEHEPENDPTKTDQSDS